MATREQARQAKALLAAQLGGEDWLRGLGLGGSGEDFAVKVNVDRLTPGIASKIPKMVMGVDVVVEEVGEISPYGVHKE